MAKWSRWHAVALAFFAGALVTVLVLLGLAWGAMTVLLGIWGAVTGTWWAIVVAVISIITWGGAVAVVTTPSGRLPWATRR